MKIAIPTKKNMIDNHFGHSDYFTIIEINGQQEITKKELFESKPVCGCKSGLAGELEKRGVKLLLAEGIGQGAVKKLELSNIKVIQGFTGTIDEVLDKWKSNDYTDEIKICTDHDDCSH